jgi:hypothetical protein
MVKKITVTEKGTVKVLILGNIDSVVYGQTQNNSPKVTACIKDGEKKHYVTFVNSVTSTGSNEYADMAKKFFESKYFEKGYVGHQIAIKATVSESVDQNGKKHTTYFGVKLYNPKSKIGYRAPVNIDYGFGPVAVKETHDNDGEFSASIPLNVYSMQNRTYETQWMSGEIDQRLFNDLQKVDGKCPIVLGHVEEGNFVLDKIFDRYEPTETQDAAPAPQQSAPVAQTPASTPNQPQAQNSAPVTPVDDGDALEEELEFD